LKKPVWFPETNKEELIRENYILDVVDMYRVTGNTECFFQQKYRFITIVESNKIFYVSNNRANLKEKVI
jgi:hypothetical protein